MSFDFPMILVLAAAVTGVIWLFDAVFLAPRRRISESVLMGAGPDSPTLVRPATEPLIVEYARSFFPVIVAVLVLRSFIVEPFRIPSNSMMPTLLTGDFILVNKFDYGIRLPVLDKKIIELGSPQRGDVIVFRFPNNPSVDFIKRVIGVPGDVVDYHDKKLRINGQLMEQGAAEPYVGVGAGAGMTNSDLINEDLGNVKHDILVLPGQPSLKDFTTTVPPGRYWVMGDNRDNSDDSRYWGTVPDENLVGKAFLIWMNWDRSNGGISWKRIGTHIN